MKKLVILAVLIVASASLLTAQADLRQITIDVARVAAVARAGRLGAGHALVQTGVQLDGLGQGHVRYQQTYRGIPVIEGEAIVHVDMATRTVWDATDPSRGNQLGRISYAPPEQIDRQPTRGVRGKHVSASAALWSMGRSTAYTATGSFSPTERISSSSRCDTPRERIWKAFQRA